jgi:ATP-dependent helicase/nuclease subunit A
MNSNLAQTIKLQQSASDPKNSAWVFASAGSGKTKILTDRVLRLLLDDVLASKILCLTFTKVAAAEMQNRINKELAEWILCDNEKLQKKLNDLSGNFPTQNQVKKARALFVKILDEESKIKVQTIHSFCQTIIKIFPFEAKVKPNFEVLESTQEKLLLKQAQKEVLKKALINPKLKNLVEEINAKLHDERLDDLVAELLNKKEQLNFLKENFFGIENLIDQIFKNFSLSKNQNEAEIFSNFVIKVDQQQNSKLAESLENSTSSKNEDVAIKIRNFLKNPVLENFKNYKLAFFTQENKPRKIYGTAANEANLDFMSCCQKLITDFSDQLNSLKIANNSALLLGFVDQILEYYSQLKKQNGVLDYNDLIVETNHLLANPDFSNWVKLKMDSSFDHILIDESQDTNHQQWNIIKALSEDFFSGFSAANKNRSLFIVGDEKQSIYSFQGAEADISSEIFGYFSAKLGDQLKKIELNNSFRSLEKILQAVDAVFSTLERKSAISKVSSFQEHKAIRSGFGKVEIWPQIVAEKEEKKEKNLEWQIDFGVEEVAKEAEILAEIIAKKIKSRVALNNAKYGDFMILLRNRTNGLDAALAKFFHQYQVPFSSVSKIKFSQSLLIQDLLSAAKFALLPSDDLNLACLLKSPILAISEQELFEICLVKNSNQTTIYKALEQLEKFGQVKKNLEQLITNSKQLNCFEFFYFLLHHENHQQNFIAHFGYESLEILDKFLLSVSDFCQKFSPNLQKFLEFVDKLDVEIALSSDEDNRVKISTIHSAKGLQARIVVLPDCCYNFNQLLSAKEQISWVQFDEVKLPIWCAKKEEENFILKQHRAQKLIAAKEEYLRLLYVAMTRAEDELYVGGFGKASDPQSWYEIIKNSVSDADFVTIEELLKSV